MNSSRPIGFEAPFGRIDTLNILTIVVVAMLWNKPAKYSRLYQITHIKVA